MAGDLTAHLGEFRAELRRFMAEHAPAHRQRSGVRSPETEAERADLQRWTRELFSAGYVGGDWPVEHGGSADHDVWKDLVLAEELADAEIPPPAGGSALAAQALIGFGSDAQRERYLPRIRSGDDLWCQLFSEPGAGSDLASLRTKADLVDGEWIVNGQKVWTTNGQWASLGYLLARTDPDAPKHRGISAFAVDMTQPGISVRPLREITGTSDFNEVFLDDVQLPADAMIGEPGQGWLIANATLAHERTAVGATVVTLRNALSLLVTQLREKDRLSSQVRSDLVGLSADIDALDALAMDVLSGWHEGREMPDGAPIVKLVFSELNLRLCELAVRALGPDGVVVESDPGTVDDGRWPDAWLYARAYTIAGGSSEIMRNVIAERGLRLPR